MVSKHPLADCDSCPLADRPGPVPGCGPAGPVDIAIVGEAPGFHETIKEIPFVGPSGQVMIEVLKHHGLERGQVWITNTVLCRPQNNEDPPKEAIEACRPRLMAELIEHQPKHIVAAGLISSKALLGERGAMTNLRVGPPKPAALVDPNDPVAGDVNAFDTLVIPTWHPAYALRLPDALPDIVLDVGKVFTTGTKQFTEPKFVLAVEAAEDALGVIEELHGKGEHLAIDIETGFDKDVEDTEHADRHPILCIGVAYARDKVVVFDDQCLTDEVIAALAKLFQVKKLILQNGKSDMAGLMARFGPINMTFDTMLAHYALDERLGHHSLEEMGVELLGTRAWKSDVKPYLSTKKGHKNFADIPKHVLWPYNAMDCAVTFALWELLAPAMEREGVTAAHDFMVHKAKELVHLELEGIGFDMPYSKELEAEFDVELASLRAGINEIVGRPINPGSPQQIKALFVEQGVPVPIGKVGKKTQETTGAVALEKALEKGKIPEGLMTRFVNELLVFRRRQKLAGTYVTGQQKRVVNDRVHTTYTLHVTTSGRLSSKNPNLQNIDKEPKIRNQFVAGEGNIFVQADYKQAEGRVIATEARDPYLHEVFTTPGVDIFDQITRAIYGDLPEDQLKKLRRLIKTFFYGLAYGRTAHGIAAGFNMPVREAELQMRAFMSLIPATIQWQEAIKSEVRRNGYLRTTFGRRRQFPLITNANNTDVMNEALSYKPQSTASDICLDAFGVIRPMLPKLIPGASVRLTIHDAIVGEGPEHREWDMKEILEREMVAAGRRWTNYVPFDVDFGVGKRWGDLG